MSEVKVLVEGIHKHDENNVLNIGATTTLIKSNINIIVDPGSFINKDRLLKALELENLKPGDIDAVILTHLHLDHTANVFLFPHSKIYCRFTSGEYPGQYQDIEKGFAGRFDLINEQIADGIKIIETIGHSIDHVSVLVETDLGKVVIAGDAIAKDVFADMKKEPEIFLVYDLEKYNESRHKILEIADYIIPGHGEMFKVNK